MEAMDAPYTVSVVCLGNICRSPMAEVMIAGALKQAGLSQVAVESAGTSDWNEGSGADPRASDVVARAELDLSGHVARQFAPEDFNRVDLILAMDSSNLRELRALAPSQEGAAKVRLLRSFDPAARAGGDLEVVDPFFGDPGDFDTTFEHISAALPGIVEFVRAEVAARA